MKRFIQGPLLSLALVASTAMAEDSPVLPLPSDVIDDAQRTKFRICRAVVLYEADAQTKSAMPEENTEMLRQQIEFIMSETIFRLPLLSMKDGTRRIQFFETWMLDFARDISAQIKEIRDPKYRFKAMLDCQPYIWTIISNQIDTLIRWRAHAMNTAGAPPSAVRAVQE